MSENENYTLSEQDQADLASLTEEPLDRTVLEIWEEVLSNIETMESEKIEPGYASASIERGYSSARLPTKPKVIA